MSLKKFEQNSPTPPLFGISHKMHGPYQVIKISAYMEFRVFESGLQLVLYFKC